MLTSQGFATPVMLASGYTDELRPEDELRFRTSHDRFRPPTTTFGLPLTPRCGYLKKYLRDLALGCFFGVTTAPEAR